MNLETQFTSVQFPVVIGGELAHFGRTFLHFSGVPTRRQTYRRRPDVGGCLGSITGRRRLPETPQFLENSQRARVNSAQADFPFSDSLQFRPPPAVSRPATIGVFFGGWRGPSPSLGGAMVAGGDWAHRKTEKLDCSCVLLGFLHFPATSRPYLGRTSEAKLTSMKRGVHGRPDGG